VSASPVKRCKTNLSLYIQGKI